MVRVPIVTQSIAGERTLKSKAQRRWGMGDDDGRLIATVDRHAIDRDYKVSDRDRHAMDDYLKAHNAARAQVGVGPMTWDNNVAAYAKRYANLRKGDCNLIHSNGPYGENLAKGSGSFTGDMEKLDPSWMR
ncbi:hypothetical protein ACSBR2_019079 [Camellia fascicularis]